MIEYRDRSLDRLQFSSAEYARHPVMYRSHVVGRTPALAANPLLNERNATLKRAFDIIFATLVLSLHALPMLLIALAIRFESPGPALFRQRRVGLNGRTFEMLKFRTMHHHALCCGDCQQASRDDPRVTRVGHWLRCLSLDELPQLINVLRGDMSVVGPRPHALGTRAGGRLFEEVTPHYAARHRIRPGMTGLAQVRGWRGETDTEEKLLRRIDSDLEYIATWSLNLDFRIIASTVVTVLRMRNAY